MSDKLKAQLKSIVKDMKSLDSKLEKLVKVRWSPKSEQCAKL